MFALKVRAPLHRWLLGALWVCSSGVHAQTTATAADHPVVGEVTFSKGVGFAQTPGQTPRTLGAGMALKEGDRLTTAASGTAIVHLKDGTRMTLRPQSDLLLEQYRYRESAPQDNSMVLQLLKGGFRAITGLVNKNNAHAAQVKTATATIGIRGTDFDARICQGKDCVSEVRTNADAQRATNLRASAKAVSTDGDVSVIANNGDRRRLLPGGSVYPGDMVETGPRGQTMLVFRDESKLTLGATTQFRVDDFTFDATQPQEGRFLVSLLKGTARALTGLIGKAQPKNVGFKTATATIGIRGTGLDIACDDGGCSFFNWLGSIVVTPEGQTALQVLQAGQGLMVTPTGITPLPASPAPATLPRPDTVPVDMGPLFTTTPVTENQEGLYVFVREGHLEVQTAQGTLQLGRGEVGLTTFNGTVLRPLLMPRFIEQDRTTLPNNPNPLLSTVLGESGVRPNNTCQ
jgi:hypothetical protein